MNEYEATRRATAQVVELLLPHVTVQEQRLALVRASWGPAAAVQYEIDYGGSPRQFAERFVPATLKFGRSLGDTDTAAIALVLHYLRQLVGEGDEQQQIDRLLRQLAQPSFLELPAPYKGLEPYGSDDHPLYFGRSALITNLTNRIVNWSRNPNAVRFLAVVGASGTGKSSLLRAGVLPRAEAQVDWKAVVIRPNPDPLFNLAVALAENTVKLRIIAESLAADSEMLLQLAQQKLANTWSKHSGVLLVVDQFEELLSGLPTDADPELLERTRKERFAFVDNLLRAASAPAAPLSVLVTLRSDFYPEFQLEARYANLWTMLKTHHEWLEPLSDEDIREIIEGPAATAGYQIEAGLADAILGDLDLSGGRPKIGSLPLLSTALLQTWEHRRGGELRREDYWNAGGVSGAIRNLAEDAYQSLRNDDQRQIAEELFLRMTHTGEGIKPTRRRVPISELQLQSFDTFAVNDVIDHLLGYRLIVRDSSGKDTDSKKTHVELIHEALIHEWSRFAQWLQDDLEVQRFLRPLTESAERWQQSGRDPAYLYTGNRLRDAQRHIPRNRLNSLEADFVSISMKQQRFGSGRNLVFAASAVAAVLILIGIFLVNPQVRRLLAKHGRYADTILIETSQSRFEIEKYEVTNERYAHCVEARVCDPPNGYETLREDWDNVMHLPVRSLGAADSLKFCNWIGRTLPTATQWVAISPPLSEWPQFQSSDAVLCRTSNCETPAVVGSTAPQNSFGMYDIVGNVDEWTRTISDWQNPDAVCSDVESFTNISSNTIRLGHGYNTWWEFAGQLYTNASESTYPANERYPWLGFRCASLDALIDGEEHCDSESCGYECPSFITDASATSINSID